MGGSAAGGSAEGGSSAHAGHVATGTAPSVADIRGATRRCSSKEFMTSKVKQN
jgi:hypothetical protein